MTKPRDVSRAAATTLDAIDTELRRAEDLHWTDPQFLAWERGQVGAKPDITEFTHYDTGEVLQRWRYFPADRYGVCSVRPIATLTLPPSSAGMARMRTTAGDYPPLEHTVHGPLLLGPEPEEVWVRCGACDGLGGDLEECGACGGTGRGRITPDTTTTEEDETDE